VQKDRLEKDQKCLIVGASGGIGTLAIQMAKQRGAYVIAVCSEKNSSLVKSLGADEANDYTSTSFVETLKNKTKLDLVVDYCWGSSNLSLAHGGWKGSLKIIVLASCHPTGTG
jgi:NADPH:quinone reductase-like Zn-dependent oxidoreductase